MSQLIVEYTEITNIHAHPNADSLELANVKGWQVCVKKGKYKNGDKVVFVPPDACIPVTLAQELNVVTYCGNVAYDKSLLRIKAARLRGEPSYGLVFDARGNHTLGENVVDFYGIKKFDPPSTNNGDALGVIPKLFRYTSIEHYGNFADVLENEEEIVITEKIHGRNHRAGFIVDEQQLYVGSHNVVLKPGDNAYWNVLYTYPNIAKFLSQCYEDTILYGEIYGFGMQDMHYGMKKVGYRAFDCSINGQYLDYDDFAELMTQFDIPTVPLLYRGQYSSDIVKAFTDGSTTLAKPEEIDGKFKGREGIVIRPVRERNHPKLGRVILKSVSVDYLSRRGGTDEH